MHKPTSDTTLRISLVPRSLTDYLTAVLHSCERKSGSSLGTRLIELRIWAQCNDVPRPFHRQDYVHWMVER